jgi:hypothetical protein
MKYTNILQIMYTIYYILYTVCMMYVTHLVYVEHLTPLSVQIPAQILDKHIPVYDIIIGVVSVYMVYNCVYYPNFLFISQLRFLINTYPCDTSRLFSARLGRSTDIDRNVYLKVVVVVVVVLVVLVLLAVVVVVMVVVVIYYVVCSM